MSLTELCKIKGLGPAKAVSVLAAFELGKRRQDTERTEKPKISSSTMVYKHMMPFLLDLQHEEFWVIMLNRANEVIRTERISSGGMSGTVA
ncbi:MAG: JAB domain-containing protein, partial [Bacteroidota bacterium]